MVLSEAELIKNLKIRKKDKVLDLGGSMKQHKLIEVDTLADIIRPEEAPYGKSKLLAKKFVKVDFTKNKLPFRDKQFDVVLCTHVLEDLPSPFLLLSEMERVAKRGFIATPEMGRDLVFSHFNLTDWGTGSRRVPGWSHHKWLFYSPNSRKHKNSFVILPKNYGVLYSSMFHFVNWSGNEEFRYYWKKKINFRVVDDLDLHKLITEYKKYVSKNKKMLTKGAPLVYLDSPFYILKELIKKIFKRGKSFNR